MKTTIGLDLKELVSEGKFDKNIYDKLFCVIKSENFTSHRIGYYYGCQIIKMIYYEYNINKVFRLEFNDIKKYINAYFKIKIV